MSTASDPLLSELKSYGSQLLPGSAERLAQLWGPTLRGQSRAALAVEVARRLDPEKGVGKAFLNRGHKPPEGQTALGRVLARHVGRGELTEATAADLANRWGADLAAMPHDRAAGEVVRRLALVENRGLLRPEVRPPLPGRAASIVATLAQHFPEVDPARIESFALARQDLAESAGPSAESALVRRLAGFLTTGTGAEMAGMTTPLGPDDARHNGVRAPAPEPRQPAPVRHVDWPAPLPARTDGGPKGQPVATSKLNSLT